MNLVKDQLVPAVRADHPLVGAHKLRLADLLDLDWIIYRRSHTGLDVFEQTFAANHLALPKSTIECTSFACALALVENGDYVTLVPSQIFFGGRTPPSIALLPLDLADATLAGRSHLARQARIVGGLPRLSRPKSSAWRPGSHLPKAAPGAPGDAAKGASPPRGIAEAIAKIDQSSGNLHQFTIMPGVYNRATGDDAVKRTAGRTSRAHSDCGEGQA